MIYRLSTPLRSVLRCTALVGNHIRHCHDLWRSPYQVVIRGNERSLHHHLVEVASITLNSEIVSLSFPSWIHGTTGRWEIWELTKTLPFYPPSRKIDQWVKAILPSKQLLSMPSPCQWCCQPPWQTLIILQQPFHHFLCLQLYFSGLSPHYIPPPKKKKKNPSKMKILYGSLKFNTLLLSRSSSTASFCGRCSALYLCPITCHSLCAHTCLHRSLASPQTHVISAPACPAFEPLHILVSIPSTWNILPSLKFWVNANSLWIGINRSLLFKWPQAQKDRDLLPVTSPVTEEDASSGLSDALLSQSCLSGLLLKFTEYTY